MKVPAHVIDSNEPYDVVTLGETMVRFSPAGYERFGQSRTVEMHVAGSESNTAIGLARLGHRVCWLSRLTNNAIGRWIATEIASHGVDVSHVAWTDNDRVGTYYMERGVPPRSSQVFYDRAESAISHMQPEELPSELLRSQAARVFHTSGITLGISTQARQTALRAIELARGAGQLLSFDLNYRMRLWPASAARAACEPVMALSDLVFLPIRDAQPICGTSSSDPAEVSRELHLRWPRATIVVTRGNLGAVAIDPAGTYFEQPAYSAVEVERLGGGDAFSAGYLSAFLTGKKSADALRWACATAAIKYTIPGDLPLIDRSSVAALVADESQSGSAILR